MEWNNFSGGHALRKAVGITMLALLLVQVAGAVPVEEWNRTFGGTWDDHAHAFQQTVDGGYIIAGSNSFESDMSGWLIKTNSSGIEQWNITLGGYIYGVINSVHQTADGGYILAYDEGGAVSIWSYLIKIDGLGNIIWKKELDQSSIGKIDIHVQETTDKGFIISGYTCEGGLEECEGSEGWLIKTDMNGVNQWNKTYPGVQLGFIQQTKDGGYIYSASNGLHKIDAYGNDMWIRAYLAEVIRQTTDGGFILLGFDGLRKLNASGYQMWIKTTSGWDVRGWDVRQTSDGGYIITGILRGPTDTDARLLKTDAYGNQQWAKTFGGDGDDIALSVQQTSDGSYIVAGYTDSFGYGGDDAWLIKFSSEGGITGSVHNINKGTNYTTIQAAINDASPEDEIHVDSGMYYENVNINKRLTLIGEGASVVTVQAADALNHVFNVNADYVNISGFTVKQVQVYSGLASGIVLNEVKYCNISENIVDFSSHGIALVSSKNNIIENNIVRRVATGISLRDLSNSNIIRNNTIEMNNYGIYLYNVQYDIGPIENIITRNEIINNYHYGILLKQSNGNTINYNNFINNTQNANSTFGPNSWDSSYPSGGNYWSDYTGVDLKSGPSQNLQGSDGIGDTPYLIPGGSSMDGYPLMKPWSESMPPIHDLEKIKYNDSILFIDSTPIEDNESKIINISSNHSVSAVALAVNSNLEDTTLNSVVKIRIVDELDNVLWENSSDGTITVSSINGNSSIYAKLNRDINIPDNPNFYGTVKMQLIATPASNFGTLVINRTVYISPFSIEPYTKEDKTYYRILQDREVSGGNVGVIASPEYEQYLANSIQHNTEEKYDPSLTTFLAQQELYGLTELRKKFPNSEVKLLRLELDQKMIEKIKWHINDLKNRGIKPLILGAIPHDKIRYSNVEISDNYDSTYLSFAMATKMNHDRYWDGNDRQIFSSLNFRSDEIIKPLLKDNKYSRNTDAFQDVKDYPFAILARSNTPLLQISPTLGYNNNYFGNYTLYKVGTLIPIGHTYYFEGSGNSPAGSISFSAEALAMNFGIGIHLPIVNQDYGLTFTLIGGINGISGDLLFINKHFSDTLSNLLNQEHEIGYCPICITFKIRDYIPFSNELLDLDNKVSNFFISVRSSYQQGITGLNWEFYLEPSNIFTILEKLSENIGNSPEPVESSVDDLIKTYPTMMKTNNFLINSLSGIAELFKLSKEIGLPFTISIHGSTENFDYISNRKDINEIMLQDDIGYFYTAPLVGTYSPKIDIEPLKIELPEFEIQFKQTKEYKEYYNEIINNYQVLESMPGSFTYISQKEFTQTYFEENSVINYIEVKQGISNAEKYSEEYQIKESIKTDMEQKMLVVVGEGSNDIFAGLAYKSSFSFFYDEMRSTFVKITSEDIKYFVNFLIDTINTAEQKYKDYRESVDVAELSLNELFYMGNPLTTGYDDPSYSIPPELLPGQFDIRVKSEPMTLKVFNSTFIFANLTNVSYPNATMKIITNSYSPSTGYPQIPIMTLAIQSPANQTIDQINVTLQNGIKIEEITIPMTLINVGNEPMPGVIANISHWPIQEWNWDSNTVENITYTVINLFPFQYDTESHNGTYYETINLSIKTKIAEPVYKTVKIEAYPNIISLGPSSELKASLRIFNDYAAKENSSNLQIRAEIPDVININDTDGIVSNNNGKTVINWNIPELKNDPFNYSKFLYLNIKSPNGIPNMTVSMVNVTVSYIIGNTIEENNLSIPIILVPPNLVDIEIKELDVPNILYFNNSINISSTILNNGTSTIAMIPVRLYLDKELIKFETVDKLNPQENRTIYFNFTPEIMGRFNITSTVVRAPSEVNIENNIITKEIFVVGLPKTGDINGDGKLTLVDAIYLAKHVGGFSGYEIISADGDINANGKITLVDAIYLAKHVGGFIGYEKIY